MQQQGASQGQAEQAPKRSMVVAGIGAAVLACAITAVVMTSGTSPVAVKDQAADGTKQCRMLPREILLATTVGSGTVRLREGSYLSPPITLTAKPQSVVFPLPRPETTPVEEVITIEGNATDVVMTSPVTPWRRVFESVTGVSAFNVAWKPMKTC
ncbi:MAG: hypothetical protein E7813_05615 [Bradyrhizobium sp.]|uniref:hypothetical protein n=1 Tax=Bradyrhizobium sp. TaxID=376 RepID=UPI00120E8796|nr:hypothetical protein [Bradyrhizobium sp.]THD71487.1 MAG: hypothetical protein E7813_05615 [Bradyrhizobium sp.]